MFGTNIPDTTGHPMTIQFPTSPSVCFCTTLEKRNTQKTSKNVKNILDIIDCNLTKDDQILIVFGISIPDITIHRLTV